MSQVLAPVRRSPEASARGRTRRRLASGYWIFLIPSAVLVLLVIVVPLLVNIGISFTNWQGIGPMKWTGLSNYRQLLADSTFWSSFWHNIGLIIAMAVIPTVVGLITAAALYDFVGKRFGPRTASVLRACIYLPQVMPLAVMGVVWSWILTPDNGVLNSVLSDVGLRALEHDWLGDPKTAMYTIMGVMVWIQLGYPLVIFMAGLQRIDPSLYEAASIDGASWWRRFVRITVPLIRPETYVVLLTCTVAALKAFPVVAVLTNGGPGTSTQIPSYYSYVNYFTKTQVGYGAAIATVMVVIIAIITVVFLRVQDRGHDAEARS
jgi:raffinose/stachyose/melibiose transport system permease protein